MSLLISKSKITVKGKNILTEIIASNMWRNFVISKLILSNNLLMVCDKILCEK